MPNLRRHTQVPTLCSHEPEDSGLLKFCPPGASLALPQSWTRFLERTGLWEFTGDLGQSTDFQRAQDGVWNCFFRRKPSVGSFLKLCEGLHVSLLPTLKMNPQGLHCLSRVPGAQFEGHQSTPTLVLPQKVLRPTESSETYRNT